jgi:hypothetical protein
LVRYPARLAGRLPAWQCALRPGLPRLPGDVCIPELTVPGCPGTLANVYGTPLTIRICPVFGFGFLTSASSGKHSALRFPCGSDVRSLALLEGCKNAAHSKLALFG